jgi:hypothetical protein
MANETALAGSPQLGLFSLVHGDRLGAALGHFAISSPAAAATIAAASGFSAVLVTLLEGSFINPALSLDLAHDIGWWNQFVFAMAALVYITSAYFGSFPRTLSQLVDRGVLQASDQEWKKVRRFTSTKLTSPSIVVLPYICGAASALLSFYVIHAPGAWFDIESGYAGWLVPLHSFMLYFLLTYLALRLYFAYLILRLLFEYRVNIQPFHTDGCGGLGSLKDLSANLYLGMLMFGFIAAAGMISNAENYGVELWGNFNIALLGSYVFITSVAFFLPLYATSGRMREAQESFLDSINQRYRDIQGRSGNDLVGRGSNEDILALDSLRATARAMQVWPFNYTALLKFLGVVSSPLLLIGAYLLLS